MLSQPKVHTSSKVTPARAAIPEQIAAGIPNKTPSKTERHAPTPVTTMLVAVATQPATQNAHETSRLGVGVAGMDSVEEPLLSSRHAPAENASDKC
jgi:hypothetical protein